MLKKSSKEHQLDMFSSPCRFLAGRLKVVMKILMDGIIYFAKKWSIALMKNYSTHCLAKVKAGPMHQ